jgi:hypothetical protein
MLFFNLGGLLWQASQPKQFDLDKNGGSLQSGIAQLPVLDYLLMNSAKETLSNPHLV